MAWQDRLREAAYTSPGGTRIRFDFESVSREVTKRTSAFAFPGVDQVYVQDNGHGARRFPLRCYFHGPDHDLEAADFERALLERGVGRLEHPFYGTFDVVPFGDITRRDDLKSAAAQTVVQVTFWTSVSAVYPQIQTARRSEVLTALDTFVEVGAQQFEDSADLSTVAARANTEERTKGLLTQVSAGLDELAKATEKVNRRFQDAVQSVNLGIDVLVGQPLLLAQQLANLITAPARAAAGIRSRLDGYADLAERITSASTAKPWEAFSGGVVLPGRRRLVANDFHLSVVGASAAVAGAARSVVEHQFAARPEAIASAEEVLAQLDTFVTWLDRGYEALGDVDAPGGVDTGATYQALQEAVSLAAGYLVEISFTLLPERRIVLDRARTIVDLAAELYGSVDDRLDYLIDTNALTGAEILELPAGKTIVYYA